MPYSPGNTDSMYQVSTAYKMLSNMSMPITMLKVNGSSEDTGLWMLSHWSPSPRASKSEMSWAPRALVEDAASRKDEEKNKRA